ALLRRWLGWLGRGAIAWSATAAAVIVAALGMRAPALAGIATVAIAVSAFALARRRDDHARIGGAS
ncbi:MAG TPA: hypothetical protein VLX92_13340, partial [Kofleriaceae bacterium]|nr:hypothetical protein [Kofleriaceae bacterium]